MIISKNANDRSISTEEQNGLWHLIFDDDNNVAAFFESVGQTSTQKNLFVGTKEECDAFISENSLILPPIEEDVVSS
jgi:hypothetical protein